VTFILDAAISPVVAENVAVVIDVRIDALSGHCLLNDRGSESGTSGACAAHLVHVEVGIIEVGNSTPVGVV